MYSASALNRAANVFASRLLYAATSDSAAFLTASSSGDRLRGAAGAGCAGVTLGAGVALAAGVLPGAVLLVWPVAVWPAAVCPAAVFPVAVFPVAAGFGLLVF